MCSIPGNETLCSSVHSDGWQSLVSWLGQLAGWVGCTSCPVMHGDMGKHANMGWLTETQEVQGLLINSLTIDRCIQKLPPYLAYILWNCSGVDVNNLESIFGNDLAPTGSVSNTVWNILGEFQRSEARCTEPQWKYLGYFIPPSAVYMRRWIGSALIRVMVSRLFGAKPLPEPVLNYNQLDPREQTSVKL